MGLFDFFSNTAHKRQVAFDDDKMKLTRQDIIDLAWSMESLQPRQKEMIKNYLMEQMDDGGVTMFEYKNIIRRLAERRVELGLSEIDIKNLRRVMGN